ncbi:MAG: hypothetical protein EXR03_00805 [Pseudolabrys sp.]|nr:hypothetical protein [Pseudolabrys sp.]
MSTSSLRRAIARLMLATGVLLLPATVYAADGAFAVDDVEVGKPGECKIESWASAATNHDFTAVTSPACVVKLGIPVELGAQLQRSRGDGVWGTSGTLKAKTNLIPVENHPFGLGISGGSTWDLITGAHTGGFINVPVTFQIQEKLRINVNGGWLYDNAAKIHYLTWGAGLEWNFVKPLTLIGEVYGQAGRLSAVGKDEAPAPNSIREPRTQIGLRVTPQDNVDLDLIWGHNIIGENAQWLTLGVNLRF